MGISSLVKGLIALPPVNMPLLGLSSAVRSISLSFLTSSIKAFTASMRSLVVICKVKGCSGANTTYVTP